MERYSVRRSPVSWYGPETVEVVDGAGEVVYRAQVPAWDLDNVLRDLRRDINRHLRRPGATLGNYKGIGNYERGAA